LLKEGHDLAFFEIFHTGKALQTRAQWRRVAGGGG
jgi:hypothetical protein